MGFNFPNTPAVGAIFSPGAGLPQYRWDGEKWAAAQSYADGGVRYDAAQVLTSAQQTQARSNIYAAPFDAMSYSGLQINGACDVSQEIGQAGTTTNNTFICDQWRLLKIGTMIVSAAQVTSVGYINGHPNLIVATTTTAQASLAAGDVAFIEQPIEGYRIARLGWGTANAQPITIGFWSAHARTGLYSVVVRNGSTNRSYATTYTQNVATAPQYNTVTIPGDTGGSWAVNNAVGMYVDFTLASGTTFTAPAVNTWYGANYVAAPGQVNGVAATSDAFRFSGVIVLPGTQASTAAQSPFIMRPYDQELQLCKRYWQLVMPETRASAIGASSFFGSSYSFQPEMRVTPTTAMVAAGISANASNYTFVGLSPKEGRTSLTSAASGDCYVLTRTYSCDARL